MVGECKCVCVCGCFVCAEWAPMQTSALFLSLPPILFLFPSVRSLAHLHGIFCSCFLHHCYLALLLFFFLHGARPRTCHVGDGRMGRRPSGRANSTRLRNDPDGKEEKKPRTTNPPLSPLYLSSFLFFLDLSRSGFSHVEATKMGHGKKRKEEKKIENIKKRGVGFLQGGPEGEFFLVSACGILQKIMYVTFVCIMQNANPRKEKKEG